MSLIAEVIAAALNAAPPQPEASKPAQRPPRRALVARDAAKVGWRPTSSLVDARVMLAEALNEYMESSRRTVFLARVAPGVGKSFSGVQLAERIASQGHRVFFAGPRKDFWHDVQSMAGRPDFWYRWLPRQQFQNDEDGVTTCWHTEQMGKWLARGYDALDLCANPRVCGWDVIANSCPYHKQKKVESQIIFGQHAHIAVGHPLLKTCKLLVADEAFYSAFLRLWRIPANFVQPRGLDPLSVVNPLTHHLAALCEKADETLTGPELIAALGGADYIIGSLGELDTGSPEIARPAPYVLSAAEVDQQGYNHLPTLLRLLYKEAVAFRDQKAGYISRIAVRPGALFLNLRYMPGELPEKIVILDGTGNADMYRQVFGQEIELFSPSVELHPDARVFQIWNRANGKSSMMRRMPETEEKQGVGATTPTPPIPEATESTQRLVALVARIIAQRGYQHPLIITHQAAESQFAGLGETAHYYGVRGTNRYAPDAVFCIGAPQPAITDLVRNAAALIQDRMTPFDTTWSDQLVQYQGHDLAYPVSGFWRDPDLSKLLSLFREDEMLQAAHRGRPTLRPVHIWLLSNVPLDELPPDEVLSVSQILNCPDDIKPWVWLDILAYADSRREAPGIVTSRDIVERFECDNDTARKYLARLVSHADWQRIEAIEPRRAGKPAMTIAPNSKNNQ